MSGCELGKWILVGPFVIAACACVFILVGSILRAMWRDNGWKAMAWVAVVLAYVGVAAYLLTRC